MHKLVERERETIQGVRYLVGIFLAMVRMLRFEIGERWFEGEGSSRESSESERDHLLSGGEGSINGAPATEPENVKSKT